MYMRQGREGIECIKYMFMCVEGDIYVCVCIYMYMYKKCLCFKNLAFYFSAEKCRVEFCPLVLLMT